MSNKPQIQFNKISAEQCPKTSPVFGYFYEDILKKKSLRYIDGLKSIYDPGIFSKNSRNTEALKAFIIQGKSKSQIIENFKSAVNNNDFIILPYFDYEHDFSVNGENYQIKKEGSFIQVFKYISMAKKKVPYFYEEGKEIYFEYKGETYYYEDFQINQIDCLQIYLLNTDIFMITFYLNLEIDGFFVAEKDFNIKDFKAEEYHNFSQNENLVIKKGTKIIFEVKSGNNMISLAEQIKRDFEFFKGFFNIYPGYNINDFVLFGFLRTDKKLINFENSQDFQKIKSIPIPVILFRYTDTLFGEDILYESVEFGEIKELKYMVAQNSKKLEQIEAKLNDKLDTKKFDEEMKNLKKILQEIKNGFGGNNNSVNQENSQRYESPQNLQSQGNQKQ